MIEHSFRTGANAGGYWIDCACGWEQKYIQTFKERRKARERHLSDVENKKLWYVLRDDALAMPPFESKKQAMTRIDAKSTTMLGPGRYSANGFVLTTDPPQRVVSE